MDRALLRRAALAALALATAIGCRPAAAPAANRPDAAESGLAPEASLDGKSVHFLRLLPFAPDSLLEMRAGKTSASTAQIGEVGLTEVERSYSDGRRTAKLRIVDTSLNRGSRAPVPVRAFEDEEKVGRPLLTAGASGYVELDKESRHATANLIVADRVLVALSLENAESPEEIERLAASLDLRRLEALLRPPAE